MGPPFFVGFPTVPLSGTSRAAAMPVCGLFDIIGMSELYVATLSKIGQIPNQIFGKSGGFPPFLLEESFRSNFHALQRTPELPNFPNFARQREGSSLAGGGISLLRRGRCAAVAGRSRPVRR